MRKFIEIPRGANATEQETFIPLGSYLIKLQEILQRDPNLKIYATNTKSPGPVPKQYQLVVGSDGDPTRDSGQLKMKKGKNTIVVTPQNPDIGQWAISPADAAHIDAEWAKAMEKRSKDKYQTPPGKAEARVDSSETKVRSILEKFAQNVIRAELVSGQPTLKMFCRVPPKKFTELKIASNGHPDLETANMEVIMFTGREAISLFSKICDIAEQREKRIAIEYNADSNRLHSFRLIVRKMSGDNVEIKGTYF